MFLIKKILSRLLFPVPLSLEFLFAGLILLWFTRRQRAGKLLVTSGALLLLVLSNDTVAGILLRPLEHQYPPMVVAHLGPTAADVGFIAVLGGFGDHDPEVPVTSHVSPGLMVRLIEAVRLQREIPGSKLVLLGGNDSAQGMSEVAESLGVSPANILRLAEPRDTDEESRQIAPIVGHRQFILVTSAAHMPRAMRLFRQRGLQPLAAPADFLSPRHDRGMSEYFPDGLSVFKSQTAFYEYLGLTWEALRARFQ